MILTVHRFIFSDHSTISSIDCDGVFQCYGLEPVTRTDDVKPRAIPEGSYKLKMLPSARFGKPMPHVLMVPGFTEIEIHIGNFAKDTDGCLLVGKRLGPVDDEDGQYIIESEAAFHELMAKLDGQEDMTIEYVEERAVSA